jgi:hypothetical protein
MKYKSVIPRYHDTYLSRSFIIQVYVSFNCFNNKTQPIPVATLSKA